jgi:hypothetical protein
MGKEITSMKTQFHFKGFEPNHELKTQANLSLNRTLGLAPYGSTGVGLLEKQENGFRCSVDIYSRYGPFIASAVEAIPELAIAALSKKLKHQLEVWWSCRNETSWVTHHPFHAAS